MLQYERHFMSLLRFSIGMNLTESRKARLFEEGLAKPYRRMVKVQYRDNL